MSDEKDIVDEAAAGPAEATVDGQTVKRYPLPDLMAYERARRAETGNGFGIRFAAIVPGGHR